MIFKLVLIQNVIYFSECVSYLSCNLSWVERVKLRHNKHANTLIIVIFQSNQKLKSWSLTACCTAFMCLCMSLQLAVNPQWVQSWHRGSAVFQQEAPLPPAALGPGGLQDDDSHEDLSLAAVSAVSAGEQAWPPPRILSPSLKAMEHLEGEAYRYEEDMACGMEHNECSVISPGLICKYVSGRLSCRGWYLSLLSGVFCQCQKGYEWIFSRRECKVLLPSKPVYQTRESNEHLFVCVYLDD